MFFAFACFSMCIFDFCTFALTSTFARYKDFCTLLLHVTKHVNIQHSFLVIKCCRVFEMLEVYHKKIKK